MPDQGESQPLSAAQERRWILDRMVGRRPIQQMAFLLTLRGSLSTEALVRAVVQLRQRHHILRCRFRLGDGGLIQEVVPAAPGEGGGLRWIDLSALPEDVRRWEAERLVVLESRSHFDLAGPLPLRLVLLVLGPRYHQLLLTGHQIALDRASFHLLVAELAALYNAHLGIGEAPPEPPLQFLEVAAWQQRWVRELAASLLYWHRRLADLPPRLDLPSDRPRQRYRSGRGGQYRFLIAPRQGQAVTGLAESSGATTTTVFLTALIALLHRQTGAGDLAVGVPVAGRRRRGTEGLPGPFEDAVVVRSHLPDTADPLAQVTGRGLLARIGGILEEALEHQAVPFAHLLRVLQIPRSCFHHPLFQIRLAVTGNFPGAVPVFPTPPEFEGLQGTLEAVDVGHSPLDLDLHLERTQDRGYDGTLGFARDLFDPATAQRLVESFLVFLAGMTAEPDRPLLELACPPWVEFPPPLAPEFASGPVSVRLPLGGAEHRAELERAARAIWRAELGIAEFGDHDDFFHLGGSSLALVRVQLRLRRRLGKTIPLAELYDFPTIAGLVDLLVRDPDLAPRPGWLRHRASQQRAARRRRKRPRNSLHSWR